MIIQELESEYYAGLQRGEYDAGLRERIEKMKIEEEIKEYAEMRDSGEAEDMREEIDGIIAGLKERLDGKPHNQGIVDAIGTFVTVRAGAGGTEAQDWASMLVHMYERFAAKNGCRVKYTDISVGEVAGIKSATLRIEGKDIFDRLAQESGVHRLVRISPYNAQGKRQTSFASVEVIPLLEEKNGGGDEIAAGDLEWEFFRSGGPGGQYQNTTDSGARVRHLPTGIVVESRQERSQYQNKRICLEKLRSELKMREDEKMRELLEQFASKDPNGWGHAFRSYVLEPYKMVNDERLDIKTGKVEKILDGNLEILR